MAAMTEEFGEAARVLNRMYEDKKSKDGENLKDLEELADLLFTLVCMANAEHIGLTNTYEKKWIKC